MKGLLAAAVGIAAAAGTIGIATPAAATNRTTLSASQADFHFSCDAELRLSDDLIGSSNKIVAWSWHICDNHYWTGTMKLELLKDGRVVDSTVKSVSNSKNTDIEVKVANPAGRQNWQAKATWVAPIGGGGSRISTGVLPS